MSGHEVMVQRITTIVAELYQHGFVSRQQLMDQFTISERTLYRDLNRLGDRITHDGNGIYRLSPAYAKTQSLKELQNLARALGVAELVPVHKLAFRPGAVLPETLSIRTLPADARAQQSLNHHFSTLDKAIRDGRMCQFHYKNSVRTVAPYRLINIKGVWYLGAVEAGEAKGYQLSQMSWVSLSTEQFTPDPDISAYFAKEDDVWFSLHKQSVQIRVDASVSYYFRRRSVLPGQQIIRETPDGGLIVQTEMAHQNQLFPILRYWLPNLVIIEPASLQQRFYQQLSEQLTALSTHGE